MTSTLYLDNSPYLHFVPSVESVSTFKTGPMNQYVTAGNSTNILNNSAMALALGAQGPVAFDAAAEGLGAPTIARTVERKDTAETFLVG